MKTKGCSTLHIPIQLNKSKLDTKTQNSILLIGLNINLFKDLKLKIDSKYKISKDIKSPTTPPNLFGIERKIA